MVACVVVRLGPWAAGASLEALVSFRPQNKTAANETLEGVGDRSHEVSTLLGDRKATPFDWIFLAPTCPLYEATDLST